MKLFIAWVFLVLSSYAYALDCPTDCQCLDQGFKVTYCIDQDENSKNNDILYYFHGAGGDATNWRESFFYTSQIRQYWKDHGYEKPTVVAVSFDFSPVISDPKLKQLLKNKWILTDKDRKNPLAGLLPYFTSTLVPKIETELKRNFSRRLVVGESMGGFNSVQLALKTSIFQKAAVICAPLVENYTPFSTWADIEPYAKTTMAWDYFSQTVGGTTVIKDHIQSIQALSKAFAADLEAWSSVDSFKLLKNADVKKLPQLYITAGAYDPYLAYEGSAQFSKLLQSKGGQVEWRPQWGGHCAIDIPSLAEFLVR